MNIKKGDTIQVIAGKDRGKTGKVSAVSLEKGRVLVEGLNMFKKHKRPTRQGEKGEIITRPHSMSASNVQLMCSNCKKGSRVGIKIEGDKKFRVCKRCGTTI